MSSSTNSSPVAGLLIDLKRDAGVALHRQIESAIRARIRSGALPGGAALPPTRALAVELGVSRGVVVEAYAQLVAGGYLTSRSGGYTRVARAATGAPPTDASPRQRSTSGPPRPVVDFGYGRGDFQAFPRAAWLRSFRRALLETPDARFGYLDGRGAPELRSAIATYLNRIRRTAADADAIVITSGYAQAVSLLLGVLAARGARTVAVEDPSADDDARPVARTLGMEVRGVPVDNGGVRVEALEDLEADVLILTPSHQWPTGGVLSPQARAAVLAWAQRTGALILEDDYDAEYRYDRSPVGAIHGLDPNRVAYAGTASKTRAPALRLGWLVLPRELVQPTANAKLLADRGSPALDQFAFADSLSRRASSTVMCDACARSSAPPRRPAPSAGPPRSSEDRSRPDSPVAWLHDLEDSLLLGQGSGAQASTSLLRLAPVAARPPGIRRDHDSQSPVPAGWARARLARRRRRS